MSEKLGLAIEKTLRLNLLQVKLNITTRGHLWVVFEAEKKYTLGRKHATVEMVNIHIKLVWEVGATISDLTFFSFFFWKDCKGVS